jgi:hypothetical protein
VITLALLLSRRKSSLAEIFLTQILQKQKEMCLSKSWKCSLMSLDVIICCFPSSKHSNALALVKCAGYLGEWCREAVSAAVAWRMVNDGEKKKLVAEISCAVMAHQSSSSHSSES